MSERLDDPMLYTRAFASLSAVEHRRANLTRSREGFARFLSLWGEGDLDRREVEPARALRRYHSPLPRSGRGMA